MENEINVTAKNLGIRFKADGLTIATAESCTGGGIAQAMTEIPGSSAWFDRGFVTYSNQSKIQMLDVNQETIETYGAVSRETAAEMVTGALNHSPADCAVAVTGIAGPEGGTEEKPVGIVFLAWKFRDKDCILRKKIFSGSRHFIRLQVVHYAMLGLLKLLPV